jgi:hypothetical protein
MPRRESETQMIDPQSALVYTMVLVSAADREMTDAELTTIGESVKHLPVFHGYDTAKLVSTASRCAEMLNEEEGFEKVMTTRRDGLCAGLRRRGRRWCGQLRGDGTPGRHPPTALGRAPARRSHRTRRPGPPHDDLEPPSSGRHDIWQQSRGSAANCLF